MISKFDIKKEKQADIFIVSIRDQIAIANLDNLINRTMNIVTQNNLEQVEPIMIKYYDNEYDKDYLDIEYCIPVNRDIEGITKVHKGKKCIYTRYIGPFNEMGLAYAALYDYMRENNLHQSGAHYEKYIECDDNHEDGINNIIEIFFPVES